MKYYITIYAITLFSLISFNFQCGKEKLPGKEPPTIYFAAPLTIPVLKKTYSLEDTIWIRGALNSVLYSSQNIAAKLLLDTVSFNIPLYFHVLGGHTMMPEGGFCEFINLTRNYSVTTSPGFYDSNSKAYWDYSYALIKPFGCASNNQEFMIGIKPKVKGVFYIGSANVPLMDCNGSLPKYFQMISPVYDMPDVNLDVYNTLPLNVKNDAKRIGIDSTILTSQKAVIVSIN